MDEAILEKKMKTVRSILWDYQRRERGGITPGLLRNRLNLENDEFSYLIREMSIRGEIELTNPPPTQRGKKVPHIHHRNRLRGPEYLGEMLDSNFTPVPTEDDNPELLKAKAELGKYEIVEVKADTLDGQFLDVWRGLAEGDRGLWIKKSELKAHVKALGSEDLRDVLIHRITTHFFEEHWMFRGLTKDYGKDQEWDGDSLIHRISLDDMRETDQPWTPLQNAVWSVVEQMLKGPALGEQALEQVEKYGGFKNMVDPHLLNLKYWNYTEKMLEVRNEAATKADMDPDDPMLKVTHKILGGSKSWSDVDETVQKFVKKLSELANRDRTKWSEFVAGWDA